MRWPNRSLARLSCRASVLFMTLAVSSSALAQQTQPAAGASPQESTWFDSAARWASTLWRAELFNAGNTSVRLNQLVIAALVVIIGLWISHRFTRIARRRLLKSRRIQPTAAAAIQKIVFYTLAAVIVMVALPIAGIPITIFTVLGGAIAIGVGFGAQNLFNNLISGMIVMIEQPIRLGDIVEVVGTQGRVDEIGNRSTRIRRYDGIDVLLPNSYFLENPVVNWTLRDADIRATVSVGVAYGSPVMKVRDLIKQAVDEQESVRKDKETVVLFSEFGDNALLFEAYFWTPVVQPMDLRRLQSDIRYRIDELFREHSITIAFPQRDVHFDATKPVPVRVIESDSATKE